MIRLIHAHPNPRASRANRALLAAVADLPGLSRVELYQQYPDFYIDVAAEQQALSAAQVIVIQHPLYWYAVPALLKQWLDEVLATGWAYGGRQALAGKTLLWAATTGAPGEDYAPEQVHGFPFDTFTKPWEQTARFCGMLWVPPFVLHGAHRIDDATLQALAQNYRQRLVELDRR